MSSSGPRPRLKPGVRPARTRDSETRRRAAKEGIVQADSVRWRPAANQNRHGQQLQHAGCTNHLWRTCTFTAGLVSSSEIVLVGNSCFRLVANSGGARVDCIARSGKESLCQEI